MARKPITDFGWEIKKKLTERKLDQKQFCRLHNIPEPRLSNIIYGTRKASKYRKKIARILDIDDDSG